MFERQEIRGSKEIFVVTGVYILFGFWWFLFLFCFVLFFTFVCLLTLVSFGGLWQGLGEDMGELKGEQMWDA